MLKSLLFNIHKKFEKDLNELKYIFFEITTKCNLNCLHCGSDCSADSDGIGIERDQWFSFVEYLSTHFNPHEVVIVITGGEPLLFDALDELGVYMKKLHFRWGIVTNGYLLDKQRLESLLLSGMKYATVSLDGLEKSHSYLRNTSKPYTKVTDAIKILNQSNILSDVVTCVNPSNIGELSAVADLLIDLGVKRWRLFSITAKGRAETNNELILTQDQWVFMIQWITNNKNKLAKRGLNVNFSCEGYFAPSIDKKIRDLPFFCRAGVNIAGILNDGSIGACPNISRSFIQGSILTDDFADIWKNGYQEYRNRELIRNERCKICSDWKHCEGSSMHLYDDEKKLLSFCHNKLFIKK